MTSLNVNQYIRVEQIYDGLSTISSFGLFSDGS